jgi:hypothetical protein
MLSHLSVGLEALKSFAWVYRFKVDRKDVSIMSRYCRVPSIRRLSFIQARPYSPGLESFSPAHSCLRLIIHLGV